MKDRISAFNDRLAALITTGVASMWCAYIFAGLALYGATGVDWHDPFKVVSWISQTFLQLVLLSIIMVGQKVISSASDQQAKEMHDTVMESHGELLQMMEEMKAMVGEIHAMSKANEPTK